MNNGKIVMQLQGTKKDFAGAWLVRGVLIVLLGFVVSNTHDAAKDARDTAKDAKGSNEAVIKIKADLDARLPRIESDMRDLKEKMADFVTKAQLEAAINDRLRNRTAR